MKMSHRKIKQLLGAYLDEELRGKEKTVMEEHLKRCIECSEELRILQILNRKIKEEKIQFPADIYWDTFPKRVIERFHEEKPKKLFSIWVPRLKWELAGGIILLLLTFIVSKQVIKFGAPGKGYSLKVDKHRGVSRGEEEFIAKDSDEALRAPVVAGKSIDKKPGGRIIAKGKKEGKPAATVSLPKTVTEVLKKKTAVITGEETEKSGLAISKSGDIAGGFASDGLCDEKAAMNNQSVAAKEARKSAIEKEEGVGAVAVLNEMNDELRFAQVAERSRAVRRDLLRVLYVEAGRTRRRVDIERALKEIEFYSDSYPENFRDTLITLSDSLLMMMEEVERREKESQKTE